MSQLLRISFAVSSVALASCGATGAAVVTDFPATVGAAGGTLSGPADSDFAGVVLEIPAGALDKSTLISVGGTEDSTPLPSELSNLAGLKVALSPAGLALKKPARLTLPVDLASTADFDQTAADCRVWKMTNGAWKQLQPVSHTDTSVTVEIDSLDLAAPGIVFRVATLVPVNLSPPCTSPTGYCITPIGNGLAGTVEGTTLSDVKGGLVRYIHTRGGVGFSIVEYNVETGQVIRESQPVTGGDSNLGIVVLPQRVSLADDDTVWGTIQGFGAIQWPFTGLPTFFPDMGSSRTRAVVSTGDGRRYRMRLLTQSNPTRQTWSATVTTGTSDAVQSVGPQQVSTGRMAVFKHPAANAVIASLANNPVATVFGPTAMLPGILLNVPAGAVVDRVAIDSTASLTAVSYESSVNGSRVGFAGSSPRLVGGLPNLTDMEFSSDGFLYAIAAADAVVYRVDPTTGGVQTIPLTSEMASSPTYPSYIPQAIRRLPNRSMLVLVGRFSKSFLKVTPAP